MSHFPVTNSNLSAKHLALFLQEKYSLSENTKCQIIRAGINDTYLITDNLEKFIFRVYSFNWRSKIQIEEEIRLLNLLKQANISISYPIKDNENNDIQSLNAPEGERFGVLFSYANGQKQHILSIETHFKIGELMGRFHNITNNLTLERVNYNTQIILKDSLKQIAHFLPLHTAEMAFMQSTQTYLLQEFEKIDTSKMRAGIVHLDIWFDNLNVTEDNKITIFDFDFCGNGWLSFDIAYYILQLHNVEKYEAQDYQPKIDSFLAGYESVNKINEEEKRILPMLGISLYFFYLGVQCQRFDNFSNSFLNENYLKSFINGLIKKYADIHKIG